MKKADLLVGFCELPGAGERWSPKFGQSCVVKNDCRRRRPRDEEDQTEPVLGGVESKVAKEALREEATLSFWRFSIVGAARRTIRPTMIPILRIIRTKDPHWDVMLCGE